MRRIFAAAALAGSIAVTGLAAAPAAQAASSGGWGTFYAGNHKADTHGRTYRSHGKIYTHWYGRESTPKFGYVWFRYYANGSWHQFSRKWDGSHDETWSGRGIKKIYTWTCWGGSFNYCGDRHRIH
ncbi:hypothetical protein [Nonomuraea sp. NPDC052265]|uniref:hypothetical protein n=1 Tax=Nonomuraea sp. NPDC052265 TaxID=3364374 RepID=UPI0037C62FCF